MKEAHYPRELPAQLKRKAGQAAALTDVSPQHVLYLFLLEPSFDHQLVVAVDGATAERGVVSLAGNQPDGYCFHVFSLTSRVKRASIT